jgi:hypothetical protein
MVRGLALGFVVVALSGLVTRVLPDVWTISPNVANDRLSYPLTYWNTLGLLASLAAVLCFHLTSSLREPQAIRVLAAAVLPALGATALFTYSRGGLGAGLLGLVLYAVVARSRGLLAGLLATVPTTALAVAASLQADLLATPNPTSTAAVDQGHDVAIAVALCMAGAAVIRLLLFPLDRRMRRLRLADAMRRGVYASLGAAAAIAAIVAVVVVDVPGELSDQYDRFVSGTPAGEVGDLRTRLTDPANNGRIDQWEVALNGFEDAPLRGDGAGMYDLRWARDRPNPGTVTDAHSLYIEVLGELGIVGLLLLAVSLLMIFAAAMARVKRPNRSVYAAVLAGLVTWGLHAGIDWDWEMPAVTLWVFATGGVMLSRSERERPRIARLQFGPRVAIVAVIAVVAVAPALVLISQARLDESLDHFKAGNCAAAVESARSSSSALGLRAEPYEVVGYCELRAGSRRRGVAAMEKAVDRDPDNWRYHLGLALGRAILRQDPRPEIRKTLELNPRDPASLEAARRFDTTDRQLWRRRAVVLVERAFR